MSIWPWLADGDPPLKPTNVRFGIGPAAAVDGDRRLPAAGPMQRHADRRIVACVAASTAEPTAEDGCRPTRRRCGGSAPRVACSRSRSPSSQSGRRYRLANQNSAGCRASPEPAVGVVEKLPGRPAGQARILAGHVEAGRLGQAEVGSQDAFQARRSGARCSWCRTPSSRALPDSCRWGRRRPSSG